MGHIGVLHAFLLLEVLKGRRDPLGQAKIPQSYILVVVEKDIFRLNIAMDYLSLMQIVDSSENLPVDFPLEFLVCPCCDVLVLVFVFDLMYNPSQQINK